jgi:hypothetical protein
MRRLPSLLLLSTLAGAAGIAAWAEDPPPSQTPAQTAQSRPADPSATRVASADQPAASRKPLDLSAPPINHVLSNEQMQAMTTEHEEEPVDSVSVTTDAPDIDVPQGQLRALPWAVMHPLQAWRIFTPITD